MRSDPGPLVASLSKQPDASARGGASSESLEARTQETGKCIFSRVRRAAAIEGENWLDQLLMTRVLSDEAVKTQLFRFVDVLPSLRNDQQIVRHLRQYLLSVRKQLPFGAPWLLDHTRDDGLLSRPMAWAARFNATRMARRFIAGTNLEETASVIRSLRARRLGFTIDLLGEAVLSEKEADAYQQQYLALIDGLADAAGSWPADQLLDSSPRVNVSVKLSSLFSQFDPIDPAGTATAVGRRLKPILRAARARGAFVNFDMEQYAFKSVTLEIFKQILSEPEFRDWQDVGIAIQAYLQSSGDDLVSLAHWAQERGAPVWVRLVKGAYWDFESVIAAQNDWPSPVYEHKAETDANFERQSAFLFENHALLRPAIASHNIRSIAHALTQAERRRLRPGDFEFQMLYGMAEPIKSALTGMGQRVRVYTPYGQLLPGMAYLVRRLLENTSNESFLRAGFLEHLPEERLLMNPLKLMNRPRRFAAAHAATERTTAAAPFRNEPLTDFSRQSARKAMQDALLTVRGQFGIECPLVIAGQRIRNERRIESIDPSDCRHVVGRSTSANADQARSAVAAARDGFPAWRDAGAEHRAELLRRTAQVLRRRRDVLSAWEVYECAKPWREADADVAEAIDFCEFYAREILRLQPPRRRDVPGENNEFFYEPRGVAVIIAPWNFPLAIMCGMATAALATGNTVVMKPAEQSPIIAYKLMEAFEEAGFPPGVVNYLPGVGEEVGPVLVGHPDVAVIAFTGSRAVGLAIQRHAAEVPPGQDHIKRVITELGGKNAIIIDDDADLDEAVHGVVASAFGYAGQKCSACSRVIVPAAIYDTFLARIIETTRGIRTAAAEDPACVVSAVIDTAAHQRIFKTIEEGKTQARLAYAADLDPGLKHGCYVGPHIFAEVPPDAPIATEEIFGPVLCVIRSNGLDESLRIANSTRYALTGGIYSRSPANIERARREFRVGNLYINRKITGALVDRQPFGGFKLSGIGSKAGGPDYLLQFLEPRTITENTLRHGFAPVGDGSS